MANRYFSEEVIPLQDVAGVQAAKHQNYLEKKLEQKCGTTKHMQQIAATADNHRNPSFDSNTQCRTATDMFNDMHGTSTELVENATNYTGDKTHDSGAFQGFSSLEVERERERESSENCDIGNFFDRELLVSTLLISITICDNYPNHQI